MKAGGVGGGGGVGELLATDAAERVAPMFY